MNPQFATDYRAAMGYWAHPTNYRTGGVNTPRVFVLHTPEEPADDNPSTPAFFAVPNRDASTHYFAAWPGVIYQCVPEGYMAIANGVVGKPYPAGTDPSRSLNWQSLSVEIEGYAASIADTLFVGGPQWRGLVDLIRDRCVYHGIPLDREHIIGHYEVADNRTDPGAKFPWDALIKELQGGTPMTPEERKEFDALKAAVWGNAVANNEKNLAQDVILVDHALKLNALQVHTDPAK